MQPWENERYERHRRLMAIAEERRKIEEEEVGEFGSFWDGLA